GYALMIIGVLTLLFAVYTLWGTRLWANAQQRHLRNDFNNQQLATGGLTPQELLARMQALFAAQLPTGGAIDQIEIPKISLNSISGGGVGGEALKKGPGAMEGTSAPGIPGNAVISGHRTPYLAPFNRLDEVSPGDEITITTLAGTTKYKVRGTQIVAPTAI